MLIMRDDEKNFLKQLFQKATDATLSFTGSEASENDLIEALVQLEFFIRQKSKTILSDKLEIEFLRASGLENPQSIYGFLDEAGHRVYGTMARANTFESVLRQLQEGGALVKFVPKIFVQTDEGQIQQSQSSTSRQLEIRYQPRLAWLVEGMKAAGIYFDDLIIHVGEVDKNMVRRKPYIIIDIPRLNKQIAVCEQVGERTFVSLEILDPETYYRYNKDQLESLSMIRPVRMTNPHASWIAQINDFLIHENSQKSKINILQYEEKRTLRKPPLSKEIILEAARLWHDEHDGTWPKHDSGEILSGPLAGNKWTSIESAINQNLRGLNLEAKGIVSLLEMSGLIISHHSETKHLKELTILDAAKSWHHQHDGKWPTQHSGEITDGPLAGEKWANIDAAMNTGGRGYNGQAKSIAQLLEFAGLKISHLSKTKNLTVDMILDAAKEWHKKYGEWPKQGGKATIETGPLAGEKWSLIHNAIANNLRGIQTNSRGLFDLLVQNGLRSRSRSNKAPAP